MVYVTFSLETVLLHFVSEQTVHQFIPLQALDHAMERGAKIYAEVRGYGMSGILRFHKRDGLLCHQYVLHHEHQLLSGDAHHITQPQNDGRGVILAMERALEQVWHILSNSCGAHFKHLLSFEELEITF